MSSAGQEGLPTTEPIGLTPGGLPWKPHVAAIMGFFFGPLAGALVTYANLKRLQQPHKAKLVLLYTPAASVVLLLPLFYLPEHAAEALGAGLNAGFAVLFVWLQKKEFDGWREKQEIILEAGGLELEAGGLKLEAVAASGWTALGWGLLGLAMFGGIVVGLAFGLDALVGHYLARGNALAAKKLYAEAEREYRTAVKLAPSDDVAPLASLAGLYIDQDRKEEAIAIYREIVRREPQEAFPRAMLGMLLSETGKPEAGLNWCREALHLDPNYSASHACLAEAHQANGDYPAAIQEYCQALRLEPQEEWIKEQVRELLRDQRDTRADQPDPCAAAETLPKQTR